MLSILKSVFTEMINGRIDYVHWKSNEHLDPALLGETDLDILIRRTHYNEFLKILLKYKFKMGECISYLNYSGICDYIGFDDETGSLVHLHLHFELLLGRKFLKEYHLPFEKDIFENKIEGRINVIDPNQELVLLIIRSIIKLKAKRIISGVIFSKDDRIELTWLKEKIDLKRLIKISEEWINKEFAENLKVFLEHESVRIYLKLKKDVFKRLKTFSVNSRVKNCFLYYIRKSNAIKNYILSKKLHLPYLYRRGFIEGGHIISFLGIDGAGKSTIIKEINSWLKWKMDVYNLYFGSGDGTSSLLRFPLLLLLKIRRRKKLSQGDYHKTEEKPLSSLMKIAKFFWGITLAFEKNRKFKQLLKARQQGMIVLTDRYPQTIVEGFNDGPLLQSLKNQKLSILRKIAQWELNIYSKSIDIQPDIMFKLMIDAHISMIRKKDTPQYMIDRKIDAIKKIHFDNSIVLEIDSSGDLDSTILNIKQQIWKNWV